MGVLSKGVYPFMFNTPFDAKNSYKLSAGYPALIACLFSNSLLNLLKFSCFIKKCCYLCNQVQSTSCKT